MVLIVICSCCPYLYFGSPIIWVTYLGSWITTWLGKSCSFSLPRVPFLNCCQFKYLVISLLVLSTGHGIWLYHFLIIVYLFILHFRQWIEHAPNTKAISGSKLYRDSFQKYYAISSIPINIPNVLKIYKLSVITSLVSMQTIKINRVTFNLIYLTCNTIKRFWNKLIIQTQQKFT